MRALFWPFAAWTNGELESASGAGNFPRGVASVWKLVEKSNEGQLSLKAENAVIRPSPNGKR